MKKILYSLMAFAGLMTTSCISFDDPVTENYGVGPTAQITVESISDNAFTFEVNEEVKKGYDEYYQLLSRELAKITDAQKDNDKIFLPHDIKNEPELEKELNKVYISISLKIANYLVQGFGGYGSDIQKKVFKAHFPPKTNKNGLYSSVYASTSGVGQTWYVTFTEYTLYRYFGILGEKKEQKKILDALLKYTVSNEFYITERYDDHMGTICNWTPNASACGRVLMMLMDFYGKTKKQ